MENKTESVQQFEQFAKERLGNHLAELNTRYENEKPGKEVLQQAYKGHREIFKKELDEKIQSLLSSENNSGLKENLENIKDTSLSKLELKNQ
jgi:vacuolar-type H+-ATPase subunit H